MGTCFSYEVHFAGQFADAYTSCHYNLNRYYDPDTGRCLSVDRIVEASNGAYLKYRAYTPNYLSPYGYAINNPINYYDPNGLDTTSSRWEGPVEGGYPIAYNPSWGERGSELNKGLRDLNLLLMGSVAAGAGAGAACGTMSAETMRDVASVGYDFYFPVVTQVFCGLYQVGLLGVG